MVGRWPKNGTAVSLRSAYKEQGRKEREGWLAFDAKDLSGLHAVQISVVPAAHTSQADQRQEEQRIGDGIGDGCGRGLFVGEDHSVVVVGLIGGPGLESADEL